MILLVVLVALRKESVDRNIQTLVLHMVHLVALRKESVDRNLLLRGQKLRLGASLSARRAWIEIKMEIDGASYDVCRSPQGERG